MAKKKPDQVADNPNILPYASNVGAPVIKPTDLTSFKQEKILKTNDYYKSRYEEIKKEYQGTGCPKSELDIKNTPSPNPLFFQKISDTACNDP